MLGSEILEVAVGLAFIYLLLSLVCSAVNEWLASLLAWRARNLAEGIRNLLNDSDGNGLAEKLYKHPLIAALARRERVLFRGSIKLGRRDPSYIPARVFALALFDIIAPADSQKDPKLLADLRQAVGQLQYAGVRGALLPLIDNAAGNLAKARQNVEDWFDDAMDRVSGWYKREVQGVILVIALVVAVWMNADTIALANALWREPVVRASVVAAAEKAATEPLPKESAGVPERIRSLQMQLSALQLPLGWAPTPGRPSPRPKTAAGWILKLMGLLLTATAASLGAPFWFDVLGKLINLRAAGKQPQKETPQQAASIPGASAGKGDAVTQGTGG